MKKAKIIEISKFGPPEVLKIKEETVAEPGADEVVIEVKAVGLNFADIFERLGLYEAAPRAPFVPGFEAAGVVGEVGNKVEDIKPGTRVLVLTHFGGYKSILKVNRRFIRPLPEDYSFVEGAGFPTTYLTAYHGMINLGHIKKDEKILIHAAAGGVGTAAVQIAQIFNSEIFATCGSVEKIDFLQKMTELTAINYNTQNFEKEIRRINDGGGVDLIMDSVGGSTFRQGYRLLNPMGRLIIFGLGDMMPTGRRPNWIKLAYKYLTLPRISPFKMMPDNKTIAAFHLAYMFKFIDRFDAAIDQLMLWANEGKLRPVIGKTFPFERAAEAHKYLQGRKSIGKVVLSLE